MCVSVLGEVVEDSALRFHQIVQHTGPVAVHQGDAGQLVSLFCETLRSQEDTITCVIFNYTQLKESRFDVT